MSWQHMQNAVKKSSLYKQPQETGALERYKSSTPTCSCRLIDVFLNGEESCDATRL